MVVHAGAGVIPVTEYRLLFAPTEYTYSSYVAVFVIGFHLKIGLAAGITPEGATGVGPAGMAACQQVCIVQELLLSSLSATLPLESTASLTG